MKTIQTQMFFGVSSIISISTGISAYEVDRWGIASVALVFGLLLFLSFTVLSMVNLED